MMTDGDSPSALPDIHRICILGAGASGLAALKHLLPFHNKEQFHTIHVFEQRSDIGGVWNYTKETRALSLPLADPWGESAGREVEPVTSGSAVNSHAEGSNSRGVSKKFISAIYDTLESNIPHFIMAFKDFPFPERTALYAPHEEVLNYIQSYGRNIPSLDDHLFLNRKIRSVRKDTNSREWVVQVENLCTEETEEEKRYDAVIICGGRYNVPYIPDIPGLEEWAKNGHWVEHSRNFRSAIGKEGEKWRGKKIITVGNSASAVDIAYLLVTAGSIHLPLLQSVRTFTAFGIFGPDKLRQVAEICSFTKDLSTGSWLVNFKDGTSEKDVAGIIFCTGYLNTVTYLHLPPELEKLYPVIPRRPPQSGFRFHNLYHHLLYIPDPTLAFLAVPFKIIPFAFAELQACVLARIYTGLIPILSPPDQMAYLSKLKMGFNEGTTKNQDAMIIKEIMFSHLAESEARPNISKDAWGQFHCLNYPRDADYQDLLGSWCAQQPEKQISGGQERKIPRDWPIWGRKERWVREKLVNIKIASLVQKVQGTGRKIDTLEQLGFKYDEEGEQETEEH